jgi:hypothetical protein
MHPDGCNPLSVLPTMNRGGRNASSLSPACNTSRNGLCSPRPRNIDNRKRPLPPTQFSCGFAAVALLLPACNTSRNGLHSPRPRNVDDRKRPRLPTQFSCGFAAIALLSSACDMSRNCLHSTRLRSFNDRQRPLVHLRWPTSIIATRWMSELRHWQR